MSISAVSSATIATLPQVKTAPDGDSAAKEAAESAAKQTAEKANGGAEPTTPGGVNKLV